MPRQCHSIDSDLREWFLSAGRIALVCGLFLIPLRSVEASIHSSSNQFEAWSQLVWWAPTEQASLSWKAHREGLGGAIPVGILAPVASQLESKLGSTQRPVECSSSPWSLVELQVRLQV